MQVMLVLAMVLVLVVGLAGTARPVIAPHTMLSNVGGFANGVKDVDTGANCAEESPRVGMKQLNLPEKRKPWTAGR